MPCNSDYMNPTNQEINSLEVINFLKEVGEKVGKYDKNYGRINTLDKDVSKLCSICQKIDVSKYSLELQIWWRDHQEADKKRIQKEINDKKDKKLKEKALSKLTSYERKLLGI